MIFGIVCPILQIDLSGYTKSSLYSFTTTNGNVTISLEFDISEFSFSAIVFGQWAKIGKNRVINKVYIIQIDLWCEKR